MVLVPSECNSDLFPLSLFDRYRAKSLVFSGARRQADGELSYTSVAVRWFRNALKCFNTALSATLQVEASMRAQEWYFTVPPLQHQSVNCCSAQPCNSEGS